jgi:hypothetical protein
MFFCFLFSRDEVFSARSELRIVTRPATVCCFGGRPAFGENFVRKEKYWGKLRQRGKELGKTTSAGKTFGENYVSGEK